MTLGEHLEELRRRLFKCVVMLLLTFGTCMFIYKPLVRIVVQPHEWAQARIGIPPPERKFLAGTYVGPFFATLKLAFIVGLFLASPWIAYQLWAFVAAGLYRGERKYVVIFALPSFLLFLGGCVFGYFVLIPVGLWGLSHFLDVDIVSPTFTISEYLSLVMLLTIVMGVVFELPLVMLFLTKIGLATSQTFAKGRKVAIVSMFVFSALLTPPDVFTQLMMAGPLLLLYETGILLARIAGRHA